MQFMKQNMQQVFRKGNIFSLVQMDSFSLLVMLCFYDKYMWIIQRYIFSLNFIQFFPQLLFILFNIHVV